MSQSKLLDKGKNVVTQYDNSKTSTPIGMPCPQTGLFIRQPLEDQTTESSDDDNQRPLTMSFPTQSALTTRGTHMVGESSNGLRVQPSMSIPTRRMLTLIGTPHTEEGSNGVQAQPSLSIPTQSTLANTGTPRVVDSSNNIQTQRSRDRQRARRQSLTPEERDEINARRRSNRRLANANATDLSSLMDENAVRNDLPDEEDMFADEDTQRARERQRAWRQNLTSEDRDEINARRRSNRRLANANDLKQHNARRRDSRTNSSHDEGHARRAQRVVSDAARQNMPCAQSIAMPCPAAVVPDNPNPSVRLHASPVKVEATFPNASASTSTPAYTIGTNGDMDAFLSGLMDENAVCNDFTDEEYMFADEGSDASDTDDEDLNGQADLPDEGTTDPFDFVYSNLPARHVLKRVPDCLHCKAKRFERETDGFCCRNGSILLADPEPIPEMMRLCSSMDDDSRHFRENIRYFNGHFSFTILGVNLDNDLTNMRSGVYTFKANDTMYHNVHSFGPGSRPEHLQLYFYDDDPTLSHRKESTVQLDQEVVHILANIMRNNPYSEQFRSLGAHRDHLQDFRIELNTDKKLDQRRYNAPISSEVAAIWVEGNDLANRFKRSITLYGNNNEKHIIQATHGCYDPLSYPLFFPKGELGWHPNIPKHGESWELAQLPRAYRDEDEGWL